MIKSTITLKSGKTLTVALSEDWNRVEFYDNYKKLDGEFEFKDESLTEEMSDFLVKRMYAPEQYKRQGVGCEVLKFFRSETNCQSLYARPNDGIPRDDQSHLTGNAPNFVAKMLKLGLIDYQK